MRHKSQGQSKCMHCLLRDCAFSIFSCAHRHTWKRIQQVCPLLCDRFVLALIFAAAMLETEYTGTYGYVSACLLCTWLPPCLCSRLPPCLCSRLPPCLCSRLPPCLCSRLPPYLRSQLCICARTPPYFCACSACLTRCSVCVHRACFIVCAYVVCVVHVA